MASNPLQLLAELLQSGRANPAISLKRLASSSFYDLQYRMFVIAATFEIHSKQFGLQQRRIGAARLKLLQFVACRPWLMPIVRNWSEAEHDPQTLLHSSQRLRRGFIADSMHDDVVDLLVARNILVRLGTGTHLASGANVDLLAKLHLAGVEQELFSAERRILQELLDVRVTSNMLEGW
jgi:hypothetical protein